MHAIRTYTATLMHAQSSLTYKANKTKKIKIYIGLQRIKNDNY